MKSGLWVAEDAVNDRGESCLRKMQKDVPVNALVIVMG